MKVNESNRKSGSENIGSLLLDAVAAPVFVLSENKILYANPAARELTGSVLDELLNEDFHDWLLANTNSEKLCLDDMQASDEPIQCKVHFNSRARQSVPVMLSFQKAKLELFSISEQPNDEIVLVTVKDLAAEELVEQQEEKLAAEARHRTDELTEVINAMPDAVIIQDAEGNIIQANPATKALVGFDPLELDKEDLLSRLQINHMDGSPVRVEELPFHQALQGKRMRGRRLLLSTENGKEMDLMVSSSPLYTDGLMVGMVSVWSDVSELSQRRHELESLVGVASALRNAIVQEEMFPVILKQLMNQLKVDGASLLLPDPATGEMVVRLGVGDWAETTGRRLVKGEGVTWQVFADGQPYVNNNIQNDPRLSRLVFAGDLQCGACSALSSHSVTIGAIWVGRNEPFTEDDIRLLTGIADVASSNIYRARLFEQTQLRFQRLSALHSIDMAITSSLDLQLTLSVLLDQAVSQMRVDAADILLFDPALHWLEFASGRGFLHSVAGVGPRILNDSPAGQVALERRMILIPNLTQSETSKEYWLSEDEGFQAYFAAPLIAKGQVKGVIELYQRQPRTPDSEWVEFLETLATQAAIAIDSAELFERLQRSNEELSMAYDATIEGWSHALELRDQETHGHAQRVTELTIRLARRMNVFDEEISHYRRGVLLHDIGKMAIPDSILLKDGPLTPEEQEIMRRHPVYAYDLLHPIAYLRPALDIPYAHHEWWDGTGYPRGLKGEEIPLSARIFAVVDVWDALRSDRSYRRAWPVHKVIEHIRSMSGSHFDPHVVEEFIKMMQDTEPLKQFHSQLL